MYTLTILAGEETASIPLRIILDDIYEPDNETIVITLGHTPSNGAELDTSRGKMVITIENGDYATGVGALVQEWDGIRGKEVADLTASLASSPTRYKYNTHNAFRSPLSYIL